MNKDDGIVKPPGDETIARAKLEWEVTVDALEQVVLIMDITGHIIRGNRTVELWNLRKVTELRGVHFHRLLHPTCDGECYLDTAWSLAREKMRRGQPFFIEKKDHVINRFLSIQFRPITLPPKGGVKIENSDVSVAMVLQDITKARLVQSRITQAASQMKSIFRAVPDSYLHLAADGTILAYKSGSFSEDFFINEDCIGNNICDVLPKSFKFQYLEAIEAAHRKQAMEVIEYSFPSSAGEQVYEARMIPLYADHMDVINRNITENKRLLAIAETMDLMKNLGYIFSGIRHEIGNPINTIKMTASVLKNNLERFSHQRVEEYIDRMLTETNRVEYLLKNLKNFNMFEELNPVEIDFTDFMSKFAGLVEPDYSHRGIRISTEVHPGVGKAYTDSRALHQVLLNICNNAADALQGTAEAAISITVSKKGKKIGIAISDNGPGINEMHLQEVMKPFFTTKPQGTGLGLSIVQKILSRMEGTIDIKSREVEGTDVFITIPERNDDSC